MQPPDSFLTVIQSLQTKEEADNFCDELSLLSASLYKVGKDDFQKTATTKIRQKSLVLMQRYIADKHIRLDDREKIHELITTLQQAITSCSVFQVTLSFEPTQETIDILFSWIMTNIKNPTLLSVVVRPALIAGCILSYDGKYKDYTLTEAFTKTLMEKIALIKKT